MRLGRRSPEAKVNETVYQPEAAQLLYEDASGRIAKHYVLRACH
jgi:hypothetical protein